MTQIKESGVRLFFAMVPDVETRARVVAANGALALQSTARRVLPDNYHVTVAFIGEVSESRLPAMLNIGAAQRTPSFSLRIDAYEYWPKPEVVVGAARSSPAELTHLWEQLHARLAEHALALDRKRLRPHVTLARKVLHAPVLQAMSAFDWPVREFSLMRSETGGTHASYTVVATWPLLYEGPQTLKNSTI